MARIGLVLGAGSVHGFEAPGVDRDELPDMRRLLAPLASHRHDLPLDPLAAMERGVRRVLTAWLDRELPALRTTGGRVTVRTPGPADLAVIGANLMNPRRRSAVLQRSPETSAAAAAASEREAA